MSDASSRPAKRGLSRRRFLGISAAGVLGGSVGAFSTQFLACSRGPRETGGKWAPNVVILVADDAGWHDVGYHGSEVRTPTIDRLAKQGVQLDQFYVWPTCSPTRASLLTGRPPSRFGILSPIGGRSTKALPENVTTLAQFLRQNGYYTAITGKWHLGLRPEVGPRKYGFDHSYGYLHGQIDPYTHHYKNGDRSWHRNDVFIDEEGHATDLIANEAIRFIRELRDKSKPFLLYVPFSVPHFPLQEEDKWVEPYREIISNESRRLFAASMTHMDDAIGRVLKTLGVEGVEEDTLVIFFSDNGGQDKWTAPADQYEGRYSSNDRLGDNRPLRGWKGQLYEGGIRVPALCYWPGTLTTSIVSEPVSVSDIFPTLASLVGSPLTGDLGIEGIDVWPVITGGSYSSVERILYWRTPRQLALRIGGWKLVHGGADLAEGRAGLFDLVEDPFEQQDLAGIHPWKLKELRRQLAEQFTRDAEPVRS